MRTSAFAGLLALAASSTAQFLNQSAPFALVVLSQNETYNGTTLAACHEGAAIEGLCIGATFTQTIPASFEMFTFNFSSSLTIDPSVGQVGYLIYTLQVGNLNVSSPMQFSYNPTSNIAVPLFEPASYGQEVSFTDDDLLAIPGSLDDSVSPPVYHPSAVFRWYICLTDAGYTYTTLAWKVGDGVPQNPSCVKAKIKRVFAAPT